MQSRFERRQYVLYDLFENNAKHAAELELAEGEAETFVDFMKLDQDVLVPFLLALRAPVIRVLRTLSVSTDANIFACANDDNFLVPSIQHAVRSIGGPYCGKGGGGEAVGVFLAEVARHVHRRGQRPEDRRGRVDLAVGHDRQQRRVERPPRRPDRGHAGDPRQ